MKILLENRFVQLSLIALVIMVAFGGVIYASSGAFLDAFVLNHLMLVTSPSARESIAEAINTFRWYNLGVLTAGFMAIYGGLVFLLWLGVGTLTRERARVEAFNAELVRQIEKHNDEVLAVAEIAQIVTSTLHINDVYERFSLEVKKLVDFDRAAIYTINHDDYTFTARYNYGPHNPARPLETPLPLAGTRVEHASKVGRTITSTVGDGTPEFPGDLNWHTKGLKSVIMVPLISKGRVIGVFGMRSRHADAFGTHDQDILERLAKQIAPAVENADLYERLKEQTEAMALLDEVAQIITSTLKIEDVYEKFALEMKKLVDFDRAALNTIDPGNGTFTVRYIYGPMNAVRPLGVSISLANTQTELLRRTRKPIRRAIRADNPEFSTDVEWAAQGMKSAILVPLISKGEVIGTFGLRSSQPDAYGTRDEKILERLAKQIAPAIVNAQLFEESKAAEEQLRKLSRAVEQSASGVLITDVDGKVQYVNPKFTAVTGYTPAEIINENPRLLKSAQTSPEYYRKMWETISSGEEWHGEFLNRKKNGELYWVSESISPIRSPEGKVTHYVSVGEDVTERKLLEEQLLQAQKMESVGRLAGGIAHEFNNLLTIILGYSQIAKVKAVEGEDISNQLDETIRASERAAQLTSQLLAFSRKQHVEPGIIDLNDLILKTDKMLRPLIGSDIEMVIMPGAEAASINVDPAQVEQVLINLVVNACDAMPEGGKLVIETANHLPSDANFRRELHLFAAPCVVLTVADSGIGMSEQVKSRLFEPFFTTKGVGEGTGLGLSTCYGIVEQMGGFIEVESEPGEGSAFKIHIPVTKAATVPLSENREETDVPRGSETIMVAEDEPALRAMVVQTLQTQGYQVLEASDGEDALRLSGTVPQEIHGLVTDVIMPGVGGPELAEKLCAARPHIKVLFTSGYTEGISCAGKELPPHAEFLQKPYMPDALSKKLREVLDS